MPFSWAAQDQSLVKEPKGPTSKVISVGPSELPWNLCWPTGGSAVLSPPPLLAAYTWMKLSANLDHCESVHFHPVLWENSQLWLYQRQSTVGSHAGAITLLSRRSAFLSHPTIWDLRYCIKNFGLDHRDRRAFLAFTLSWVHLTYRRRTRSRKWGGGGSTLLRELSSKFTQNNLSERILLSYLHKRENYQSQINKGRTRCSHVLVGTRFNICPFGFLPFGSGFEFWLQPGTLVEFRESRIVLGIPGRTGRSVAPSPGPRNSLDTQAERLSH